MAPMTNFGPKREKETGVCRILYNKVSFFLVLARFIRMVKWVGERMYDARGKKSENILI